MKVLVEIEDQIVEEICNLAVMGCAYWASMVVVDGSTKVEVEEPEATFLADFEKGHMIEFIDEDQLIYWLTMPLLTWGIGLALAAGVDITNIDEDAADRIIQYSLFGKLIYR